MKKSIFAITLAVSAILLTGCIPTNGMETDRSTDSLREETITLSDGREITCVIYAIGYKGGVSCDW